MAEKAIRLGGESTADAIVSAVDSLYPEHTFEDKEFALKHNDDEIAVDTNFAAQSFWKDVRIRFFRKKSAVLGLVMIMIILLLAIFGPGMNSYTYSGQDLSQKNFAPRVPGIEQFGILDGSEKMSTTTGSKSVNAYVEKGKDDVYYWFGSDTYGRDIWTRTWEGARVSLIIAVAAAIIDMVIGMSYGLISGYFGGLFDEVLSGFMNSLWALPTIVLAMAINVALDASLFNILLSVGIVNIPGFYRIVRSRVISIKNMDYIMATKAVGQNTLVIIFSHVLPNLLSTLIVEATLCCSKAVIAEASLSFLGLGVQLPHASWGTMLKAGYPLLNRAPWICIIPGLFIVVLVLGLNLMGDGLRDAFDVRINAD